MKKTDVQWAPTYFDTYISKVADVDLDIAMQNSLRELDELDMDKLEALGDRVYAPGKWTIRDIFQHVLDVERVFSYRALRFARYDKTPLPGFDEDHFAAHADAGRRPLVLIIEELKLLRQSCIHQFASFGDESLRQTGVMFNSEVPVLAIGFTLIGHQIHHLRVIEERYYPLLNEPQ